AVILEQTWFGLSGWQWVFLIEGAPAVLLGVAIPFLLPDRPQDAQWLNDAERDWLDRTLEAERAATASDGGTWKRALRQRNVWLLALGILATNVGGYCVVFWLPTLVKGMLITYSGEASNLASLFWTGLLFLIGMAGIALSGWSSDRSGERKWHCIAG